MSNFWNLANGNLIEVTNEIIPDYYWDEESGTGKAFREALAKCKGDLTVRINSPGGDVFTASDMYTALRQYDGNVRVEITGVAMSAASYLAMAGDEILMSPSAIMMIHMPWTFAGGNSDDLRHEADVLDVIGDMIAGIYAERTGRDIDWIDARMKEESYMTAQSAVEWGFADGLIERAVAACAKDKGAFRSGFERMKAQLEALGIKARTDRDPDEKPNPCCPKVEENEPEPEEPQSDPQDRERLMLRLRLMNMRARSEAK